MVTKGCPASVLHWYVTMPAKSWCQGRIVLKMTDVSLLTHSETCTWGSCGGNIKPPSMNRNRYGNGNQGQDFNRKYPPCFQLHSVAYFQHDLPFQHLLLSAVREIVKKCSFARRRGWDEGCQTWGWKRHNCSNSPEIHGCTEKRIDCHFRMGAIGVQ